MIQGGGDGTQTEGVSLIWGGINDRFGRLLLLLREKLISFNIYIRKNEDLKVSNLSFHLINLKKYKKVSRRKPWIDTFAQRSSKWYSHFGTNFEVSSIINQQWLSNWTPRHLPKKNENIRSMKDLYKNVHSSFIHLCSKKHKTGNNPTVYQ